MGTGVPLGTGVFEFDSDGMSPLELVATGKLFDVVEDESFGDSSLITGDTTNCCKSLGDSFNVTTRLPFDDFRRAPETAGILFADTIVEAMMRMKSVKVMGLTVAGWCLLNT